jgi:long-chain acyl-CoA synthetase
VIDPGKYRTLAPAPSWVFQDLGARADRPRFHLPDGRTVTWRAFADSIRSIALWLDSTGFRPGDRAAIFAPNRVEWIAAALGAQAAGGVMVPVYPASTRDQAAYVVGHSDARVLFVDTEPLLARVLESWRDYEAVEKIVVLDDSIDPFRIAAKERPSAEWMERRVISWSTAIAAGGRAPADRLEKLLAAVELDQPGMMLYTSGTSGNPKGVPLTHRNVAVNGRDWLECNAPLLEEGATDLLWLPMSHIFGLGEVCLGNTLGWESWLTDPLSVMAKLPEVKPRVFLSVPSVWEKLAVAAMAETTPEGQRRRLAEVTGGNLAFCLSGGAGLKREVKELFHRCGLLIIEGYGLTETSPTLTLNRPGAFRFDSVGRPVPSVELRLADDGEILAKGPNVFSGYHKDPAATAEAFTGDGWFKTGDVGRFTEDGFLQIVDRKKDILVTAGGKNVPPANIELRFRDDPAIEHLVVYGDGKRYLVAGVWVHAALRALPPAQIHAKVQASIDRVNGELASYETIKQFRLMDVPLTVADGLLTATLKVRRKKVYETFRRQFEALYS